LSSLLLLRFRDERREEFRRDRLLSTFRAFPYHAELVLAVAVFVRDFDIVAPTGFQRDRTGLLPRAGLLWSLVRRPISRERDLSDDDPLSGIVVRTQPQADLTVAGDAEFVVTGQRRKQVGARPRAVCARPIGVRLEVRRKIVS